MADRTKPQTPPMQESDEASSEQLRLAREQGRALQHALDYMINKGAHDGGEIRAGDYLVGYAVEEAKGMYHMRDGKLEWQESKNENVHLEVLVRDGADSRFVPGLTVYATLLDGDGNGVGTHQQPFLWHPWLYHYGRNRQVSGDGEYTLRIRIDPPNFGRHDKKNGKRFAEPVEVEFNGVKIKTDKK